MTNQEMVDSLKQLAAEAASKGALGVHDIAQDAAVRISQQAKGIAHVKVEWDKLKDENERLSRALTTLRSSVEVKMMQRLKAKYPTVYMDLMS